MLADFKFSFSASVCGFSSEKKDVGTRRSNEAAKENLYPPKLSKRQPGYSRQGEFSFREPSNEFCLFHRVVVIKNYPMTSSPNRVINRGIKRLSDVAGLL